MAKSQLWGTHRGVVLDNADPTRCGRIKVQVAAAYGNQSAATLPWAWPRYPAYGDFWTPAVGDSVYVEFLCADGEPDPNYPIWTGTWSAAAEVPPEVAADAPGNAHYYRIQRTHGGHRLLICDKPGSERIEIRHKAGGTILFDAQGNIKINGKTIYLN